MFTKSVQPNFDLFEKLENTPGKLDKIALLKTANEADKIMVKLAVDPDMMFHLQRIDYPDPFDNSVKDNWIGGIESLQDLCKYLTSKKALKDSDRYKVGHWLSNCSPIEHKWYERVLLKDLRCGFDVSTCNKTWPDFIRVYDCALADVYDIEKDEIRLTNSLVDVKLDGVRCLAKVENGNVILRSRSGKLITTFPQIEEELALLPNNTYDGEIYVPGLNGFQRLMKYVKNDKNAPDDLDYRFIVFDIISDKPYINRYYDILNAFTNTAIGSATVNGGYIEYLGSRLGHTGKVVADNNVDLLIELDSALASGYEGLMIKDKNAPYKSKRSKNILKLKRFYSAEFKVTGSFEGKGKHEGKLGGFMVEAHKAISIPLVGNKLMVIPEGTTFNCGGGFTDEQRQTLWDTRESLVGRIAELKFQEVSSDNVPRFNVFMRFREDLEFGL